MLYRRGHPILVQSLSTRFHTSRGALSGPSPGVWGWGAPPVWFQVGWGAPPILSQVQWGSLSSPRSDGGRRHLLSSPSYPKVHGMDPPPCGQTNITFPHSPWVGGKKQEDQGQQITTIFITNNFMKEKHNFFTQRTENTLETHPNRTAKHFLPFKVTSAKDSGVSLS